MEPPGSSSAEPGAQVHRCRDGLRVEPLSHRPHTFSSFQVTSFLRAAEPVALSGTEVPRARSRAHGPLQGSRVCCPPVWWVAQHCPLLRPHCALSWSRLSLSVSANVPSHCVASSEEGLARLFSMFWNALSLYDGFVGTFIPSGYQSFVRVESHLLF